MYRLLSLIMLLGMLAACGAAATPTVVPTATPDALSFDTAPTAIVLEHRAGGGFMMPLYAEVLRQPLLRIYGDGLAIYQRNTEKGGLEWQETKFTPAEIRALLTDVLGPNAILCESATIPPAPVADAGSTTVTVNLQGRSCSATADAVFADERPGITNAGIALLKQLQAADSALQNIEQQATNPYQPEQVTLFVTTGFEAPDAIAWPFEADELRDGNTLKGDEAVAVLAQASSPKNFKLNDQYIMAVAVPVLP
jgi:hypothetical protein